MRKVYGQSRRETVGLRIHKIRQSSSSGKQEELSGELLKEEWKWFVTLVQQGESYEIDIGNTFTAHTMSTSLGR